MVVRKLELVLLIGIILLLQGCGGTKDSVSTNPPSPQSIPAASTRQWVSQFGTGTSIPGNPALAGDLMSAIVAAPDGGVYAAGYTVGTFPGFVGTIGPARPYLARFSATGKPQWVQQFSTGLGDFVFDAEIDAAGNIYLCGHTSGAYPGFTNPSGIPEAMVAKYDPNGNQLWVLQFDVNGYVTVTHAAALGNSGTLFVTGDMQPTLSSSEHDFFLAAIDTASGTVVWKKVFGTNAFDRIFAAAADADSVYLAGISSGPFPGSASQDYQGFVAKLTASDGHLVWVQPLSDLQKTTHVLLSSLAIAPDGGILVGGAEGPDSLVVGEGAYPTARALLLKLSRDSGTIQWQRTYSTGTGDQISSVAAVAGGAIYASGSTHGLFNSQFSQPAQNLFLLKLDATGTPQWVQQFGAGPSPDVQFGAQVAVNSNNDVFVGAGTMDAFPGFTNPNNAKEGFVMKFGP